jgi:hypothetical protein
MDYLRFFISGTSMPARNNDTVFRLVWQLRIGIEKAGIAQIKYNHRDVNSSGAGKGSAA